MKKFLAFLLLFSTLVGCGSTSKVEETTETTMKEIVAEQSPTIEVVEATDIDNDYNIAESVTDAITNTEEEVFTVEVNEPPSPEEILVKLKERFKMEDMIATEQIDLREEPTVDLSKFTKFDVTKEDLEISVYNRLITVTGTTLGDFALSFLDNTWINPNKMRLEEMLKPYTMVKYNFVYPDSMHNGIYITVGNMTNEVLALKDCPIYSIKVNYITEPEEICTYRTSTNELANNDAGYFVDFYQDTEYNYFMVRVLPSQGLVKDFVKDYAVEGSITDEVVDYEFGSNMIQVLGKTVDFNKATLADYIANFETDNYLELPEFVMSMMYCDGYCPDCEDKYTCYGSGFTTIPLTKEEGFYANTIWGKVSPKDVNLWNYPIDSVFTRVYNKSKTDDTLYNIAGFTNNISDGTLLDWYNSTEGKRLADADLQELATPYGRATLLHNGVEDSEFLKYRPDATGYHYSYVVSSTVVDDTVEYTIELIKNDIAPYIPK